MSKAPIVRECSAGGVVLRDTADGYDVLLIRPQGKDRWQLPKGWIDDGEDATTAAVREVREEGGVIAHALAPLSPIRFFYQMAGKRISKTVTFFVMSYVSGSTDDHDHEVDEACWVSAPVALRQITFDSERSAIEQALDYRRLAETPGEQ